MKKTSRIVLHLGFHKTGTSFLQEKIFPCLHNVNLILSTDITKWDIKNDKINIISNEGLSKSLPHYRLYSDVDRSTTLFLLHTWFPDARIILSVRDRDSRLWSCYVQYVKNGGILTFANYLKQYKKYLSMDEYVHQVRHLWKDVFVYNYDDFKNKKMSVICSLFRFIGVSNCFDDIIDVIMEDEYVNASPDGYKVRVWRFINVVLSGNSVLRRFRKMIDGVLLILIGNNRFYVK